VAGAQDSTAHTYPHPYGTGTADTAQYRYTTVHSTAGSIRGSTAQGTGGILRFLSSVAQWCIYKKLLKFAVYFCQSVLP